MCIRDRKVYSIDYQVLGKAPPQDSGTHGKSQSLCLNGGGSLRDVYEFYLTWKPLAVEIHLGNFQHCRHGDGGRQQLSLGSGQVPYVMQEKLYPAIQRGDLGEGVPEMMNQLEGVKLIFAATASGDTLLVSFL